MKTFIFQTRQHLLSALTAILVLLSVAPVFGQVNVTIMMKPPYSSYLKDYTHLENKAVITLSNLSSTKKEVYIKGSVSNDTRGLYIKSNDDYRPSVPIVLNPNQTKVITADANAMRFLDQGNAQTNAPEGTKKSIIQTGQLPEGVYQICIAAYDYQTGAELSNPHTGCTSINLTQAGPPVITYPVNGNTIPAEQKSITYSWTPPTGNTAGGRIIYDVVVVKVMPGQNPNDVINTARDYKANNPIVYKQNTMLQVYVTQPYDLKPEPGATYAMQVIVKDGYEKLVFKNSGRSEVITFKIGNAAPQPVIQVQPSPTALAPAPAPAPAPAASGGQKTPDYKAPKEPGPVFMEKTITGKLNYYFKGHEGASKPLKNVNVQLVMAYFMENTQVGDNKEQLFQGAIVPDKYEILAAGKTSGAGNFSFNVPNLDKLDFKSHKSETFVLEYRGDLGNYQVTGTYHKVLMVLVDNQYYCQPDWYGQGITQAKDIGTIKCRVKDFALTVHVMDLFTKKSQQGVNTYILRSFRPNSVPKDEATPGNEIHKKITIGNISYEILDSSQTNAFGANTFSNLTLFDKSNPFDRYFLYARINEENSNLSLIQLPPSEAKYATSAYYSKGDSGVSVVSDVALNYAFDANQYQTVTCYNQLYTIPDQPRVYGRVVNKFASISNTQNNQGEGMAKVTLYTMDAKVKKTTMDAYGGANWSQKLDDDPQGNTLLSIIGKVEKQIYTGNDGKFNFKQLGIEKGLFGTMGYYRFVSVDKKGFFSNFVRVNPIPPDAAIGDLGILKTGEAANMGDLPIVPAGSARLRIVNEENTPVKAYVNYIDPKIGQAGNAAETDATGYCYVAAPSGKVSFVVNPKNSMYQDDTVTVDVPELIKFDTNAIVITVYYKLHRIHFTVRDSITKKAIPGASVTLLNTKSTMYNIASPITKSLKEESKSKGVYSTVYDKYTGAYGGVDFAFKNTATDFTFMVTTPVGKEYVARIKNITGNIESKDWENIDILVENGRSVPGVVLLGRTAVDNADVMLATTTSDQLPDIKTTTNKNGEFVLHCVPHVKKGEKLVYLAAKPGYIGDSITEGSTTSKYARSQMYHDSAFFRLTTFNDINLTELLGFPMEVTGLKLVPGSKNEVIISGLLLPVKSNDVFKFKMDKHISFNDIHVVGDVVKDENGKPYAKPKTLPLSTGFHGDIEVYGYSARIGSELVLDTSGNKGALKGDIKILLSSFEALEFKLQQGKEIHLFDKSTKKLLTPVAYANSTSYGTPKFGIADQNGKSLKYKLFNFNVDADSSQSTLKADGLVLNSKLHTALENTDTADLKLPIGNVTITPSKMLPISSNIPFKIKLGTFDLKASSYKLSNSGFTFNGTLSASGMDIPFTNATLDQKSFSLGDNALKLDNVKLLGVHPVKVNGSGSLGYDASPTTKAWSLTINGKGSLPAAELQGLDGFDPAKKISISSIRLFSNGNKTYNLEKNQPTYKLFNVVDFVPSAMYVYAYSFSLAGTLNPKIPGMEIYNTQLGYNPDGGKLSKVVVGQFELKPINVNGVVINFNNKNSTAIQFEKDAMILRGTISDKDPKVFKNLKYTMKKSANGDINLVLDPSQSMNLGGDGGKMKLSALTGDMKVAKDAWTYFYVAGDMPESMGFDPANKRMRFDVKGDLEVKNQGVALKGINTPFGDLSMQYDIPNQRLSGSLQLKQEITSGVSMSGSASMVFDKNGFYLLAAGQLAMASPKASGGAAILIGDYTNKEDFMTTIFKQNSGYYKNFKELPAGYTNSEGIKGLFMEGCAEIPVPGVPQIDVNVGLVEAHLWVNVGADFRYGMNFGNVSAYNVGYSLYVDAGFELAASFLVACAGVKVHTFVGADLDGTYYSNGNWEIIGKGLISLSGTTWFGGGLYCTPQCDGLCVSTDGGGAAVVEIKGKLSNSGTDYSFSVKTSN